MRQKGTKTHLSTDKVSQSFEKSAKQRQKSKNLYTLNKESEQEDDSQNIHSNNEDFEDSRKYRKSKQRHHNNNQTENQSSQNEASPHLKNALEPGESQQFTSQEDEKFQYEQKNENEQRIKKYLPDLQSNEQMIQMQLRIKYLQQQIALSNNSMQAHEARQKQMVSKFAKLQAQNKRLQYEMVKITKSQKEKKSQQQNLIKLKKQIEGQKKINSEILSHIEAQNVNFFSYVQGIISRLIKDIQTETQPKNENQSLKTYLERSLSQLKESRKNLIKKFSLDPNFEKQNIEINGKSSKQNGWFSYQKQRIIQLNEQNTRLSNQFNKVKQQFTKLSQTYKRSTAEKENQSKQEKKQLVEKYNQIIQQIKSKYKVLEGKISEQQDKFNIKVKDLQRNIAHKQKIILKLKEQLKEMNVKLDQFEDERFELMRNSISRKEPSYHSKKKYIDGDFMDQTFNSNKDRSHEKSFCQYQPEKRKNNSFMEPNNQMMRKSNKNKKIVESQVQREEKDLQKINIQIEELQRQILDQFQNSD